MTIEILGYTINEEPIFIGEQSIILSGFDDKTKKPVAIKLLNTEYPSPDQLARFRHEYEITKKFESSENIIHAYDFVKSKNSYAIVMENATVGSLGDLLAVEKKLKLKDFLALSLEISKALKTVHEKQIIHKDINANNILCNINKKKATLIDFGLSAAIPRERVEIVSPNVLEGTLAYLSPEQTGRMNRGLDYRTDFYSLGVTFYQMITGELPFSSLDPMEIVHCHIAVIPKSPHDIDPSIPKVVSDIIMRLMAKKAEDRYQNMNGLIADLELCLNSLSTKGTIDPFPLATKDLHSRFQIPEKLYGREREVSTLMQTYDEVMEGKVTLMLVAGYSGIGKSALVNEIHKPIIQKHGYFISGKFDQFKRNIPYAAFSQAFRRFVNQVLTEPEEKIAEIKKTILDAVGENGKIILEVIPTLILIIGEQPPITELPPLESLNRFNHIFQNFITSVAKAEHPLVIFLDDLQWADLPSLTLLETLLLSSDCKYLFIIGAYRSNEVSEAHPLMDTLHDLEKQNVVCKTVLLGPLTLNDVNLLLTDTLRRDPTETLPLAEICYEKTGGNPFFLIQLLQKLNKEQLIEFDGAKNNWKWDLKRIKDKKISDNIVHIMVDKIHDLSPKGQKILQLAACIGTQFNLNILSKITEISQEELLLDMQEILNEGYVIAHGDAYRAESFYFTHDRIQQAAGSLISEDERKKIHIKLARLLLEITPQDKLNETLFDIVDHYNSALDSHLINGAAEKKKIAELNLKAAKLAISASAFEPALIYVENALKEVNEESWDSDYPFMIELYNTATEAAFLNSKYELVDLYSEKGLEKTKDIFDEIAINRTRIFSYVSQQKQQLAIQMVIKSVSRLGIQIPYNPSQVNILSALFKTKFFLIGKKVPDLINLPEMQDPAKKAILIYTSSILAAAYQTNPNLYFYIVCVNVLLSIRNGNSKGSSRAYATYGLITCGILNNIEFGFQFGDLALALVDKIGDHEEKTKIIFTTYFGIKHWKESVHSVALKLVENFKNSLDSGDFEFGCYSLLFYMSIKIYCGSNLKEFLLEIHKYQPILAKIKHIHTNQYISIYHQTILNLIDKQDQPHQLIGSAYDEITKIPLLIKANDRSGLCFLFMSKLMLSYLFEDYDNAILNLKQASSYIDALLASTNIPAFYFYEALTLIATYPSKTQWDKIKIARRIKSILKKFKYWTKYAPENQLQRTLLIEAEWARVHDQKDLAADLYEKAIFAANQNEFINEEAIANELTAKFYLAQGREKIASLYMQDARHCYLLWGADAKVSYLDEHYSNLLKISKSRFLSSSKVLLQTGLESQSAGFSKSSLTRSTSSGNLNLDIRTVQKSAETISNTIVLEDLLKNLMHMVIENAGAQKAYLLLNKGKDFVIEAETNTSNETLTVLQSIPISDSLLPSTIINYVIHSKESVVMDNASQSEKFIQDPYIIKTQPKSILCLPLVNQGVLVGILYMENNLIEGAFTDDRTATLNILLSQIAIAISNARLYSQTKELNNQLILLNKAYERFVPEDFLALLKKKSILDVALGDHTQMNMSVLFADIRNFTTRSEKMTPDDNFDFINSFLGIMVPIIKKHAGFVDKYIGDAIMALFPRNADDAILCALEMHEVLHEYNHSKPQLEPIEIGVGINTGLLMLGTVGETNRMAATVISDAVNIASRVESQTKIYKAPILITENTYKKIKNPAMYEIELIDKVLVKGKTSEVIIYRVKKAT
jgi:predicted ATPase/class 3 adenylate cyclase